MTLDRVGEPFAFAGEDAWDCALLGGATLDFNVMIDRAQWTATARRCEPGAVEATYALALGGYFALNLAYSFKLKQIAYLDVLSIAAGFILRVLAGAWALRVPASLWLLACTGLLAMFLGFGKRAHELAAGERATTQRSALAGYDLPTLRVILYVLAATTLGVYTAYTLSEHVVALFGSNRLVYTVGFGVVGIVRFIHLATTRHEAESPTEEMLKDPLFMLNFAAWLGLLRGRWLS